MLDAWLTGSVTRRMKDYKTREEQLNTIILNADISSYIRIYSYMHSYVYNISTFIKQVDKYVSDKLNEKKS